MPQVFPYLTIVCFTLFLIFASLVNSIVWKFWGPWEPGTIPLPYCTGPSAPLYTTKSSTNNCNWTYKLSEAISVANIGSWLKTPLRMWWYTGRRPRHRESSHIQVKVMSWLKKDYDLTWLRKKKHIKHQGYVHLTHQTSKYVLLGIKLVDQLEKIKYLPQSLLRPLRVFYCNSRSLS